MNFIISLPFHSKQWNLQYTPIYITNIFIEYKLYFTTSKSKHNASSWALTLTAIITLHQWWTIINHYHFCKILMTNIINKSHLMLFPSFYYKCAICIFSCSLHLYIKRLSLHYLLVHWYFCTADISLRIGSEALSAFRLNWRRQRNFW